MALYAREKKGVDMWFRYLFIFILLVGMCWVFRPLYTILLKSVKKVKNDYRKTK